MVEHKKDISKYKGILLAISIPILIAFILFIWWFPECYIQWHYNSLKAKEQLDSIKDMRTVFINVGAGILAIAGIYLTWRRTKALDEQNKTSLDNLTELRNRNKQDEIKDNNNLTLQQFSKASELLSQSGNENIAARLSGIYLFEKIMNSSEEYHWQIIELLTAYVREKRGRYNEKYYIKEIKSDEFDEIDYEPNKEFITREFKTEYLRFGDEKETEKNEFAELYRSIPIEEDIQAILTIIGRRNRKLEDSESLKRFINLSSTNLYKADLSEGHFEKFMFKESILVL